MTASETPALQEVPIGDRRLEQERLPVKCVVNALRLACPVDWTQLADPVELIREDRDR